MRFEFATATQIIFGAGTIREVGAAARKLGARAMIVTSGSRGREQPLFEALDEQGVAYAVFDVLTEPTVALARQGAEEARRSAAEMVIGFGGGSALDAGKATAALATNPGDPLDYLEVIGANQPLRVPPLPFIAVPTTAGTGSEVTRNAVLASPEHRVKVSLRHPLMLARVALVDPELTVSLPPDITASTGMDALTQLIEPYVCNAPNPMTDALCREGISRAARSLRRAYEQGEDIAAREDMSVASLFGGLALANARLGAVHGFAGPLGGMFPIPHGTACAALLPHVMALNVCALQARQPDSPVLGRYDEVARLVTGRADATAADGVTWVHDVAGTLKIPRLSQYGISSGHLPELVDKSQRASSMKGNPIQLTPEELAEALERAL